MQNILLSPSQCAELSQRQPCIFLDTRAPEVFASEHIPGAANIHEIFTYLAQSSPQGLTELQETFLRLFKNAGLNEDTTAILYEDAMNSGFGQSCRGFFLLQYLGYPRIHVLHGGLKAWRAEGLPLSQEVQKPVATNSFPLNINETIMVNKDQVLEALSQQSAKLVDVRDDEEWYGLSSSPYGVDFCPRKGRLPGAVWLPWRQLMKEENGISFFHSTDTVRETCQSLGLKTSDKIILYCFKGARAANTYLILRASGFNNIGIYFGSWNEWSRDMQLPIDAQRLQATS